MQHSKFLSLELLYFTEHFLLLFWIFLNLIKVACDFLLALEQLSFDFGLSLKFSLICGYEILKRIQLSYIGFNFSFLLFLQLLDVEFKFNFLVNIFSQINWSLFSSTLLILIFIRTFWPKFRRSWAFPLGSITNALM